MKNFVLGIISNYDLDYNQITVCNISMLIELFNSIVVVKDINHYKIQF